LTAASGHSSTVVARVLAGRRPLVVTGTEEGEALGSESALVHDLRSILAAPLILGDKLLGVVYLDSRVAKGLFAERDLDTVKALSNHIALALETARAAQLEVDRERLRKDLEVSRAVQSLFLPPTPAVELPGARLASCYRPAAQSGGDWWTYQQRPDGKLLVVVGDVTGHGIGSAMVTAAVAGSFATLREGGAGDDVPALLERVNRTLRAVCAGEYLMSLCALVVDTAAGKLSYWNAAAPAITLIKPDGTLVPIAAAGAPLGAAAQVTLGHQEVAIARGDRIFVGTDWFELPGATGRRLGPKGLQRLLAAAVSPGGSPQAICDRLAAAFDAHLAGAPQEDDLTMVLIEVG
jgi:serine phosphatase RsbU (regulator of sigma subunit)